ncbi:MAG: hypothetical protein A3C50_03495 [Candidatus Staskawiczbacteria bacterium RIFCSPHIGHO2_02_FULL_43_16]|uniref:Haloacid dehalogenase n=1 Tax=Candidatus Staskawiczbacteria bacterium RIFCSPHIGHO2_01_FULL_41_41 TaxID=1802203 RepID=A0A1G2HSK7_9BACT|nr:MAG: hypothetical protein A2822_02600 [Candidatus Staskawiczbacteria bacterium RIFCSPHIGHO2_01_FULL_41_41]OGZ68003.1 MAG: hypothetical protein A3C50_03495 [Candidatus Staskawiczbacteria bacterium RIFCSPHIGHO2_02_FULL_43_16]OGZ74568.1 MAG: hypothetical protein A3A12_02295 [Candidatus Staskawiczbacteria bacterium RIFCSPLOWO2_01_FULL_43_17b]
MPRYILTDVGNIMATFKFRAHLVQEIMLGVGITGLDLSGIFQSNTSKASDEDYYHDLDIGKIQVRDLWEKLIGHHGVSEKILSYPLFFSLWCRHLQTIEGVVKLYSQLQKMFELVVVSNGDAEGVRHFVYHLIGSHGLKFREVFISGECGRKKPGLLEDVAAFVRSQGVSLSDCVFIDDLIPYVNAAKTLGIPSIRFDGSKQGVEELEAALLKLGFSAP